jgi:ubiquinone/menaquinone biosynthesis C-methylase UbiE
MTMDRSEKNDHYVLRGGDQAAKRLKLLARVKWPTTRTLFRRLGIRAGMRCLDVGCGAGAVTLKLALRVGATGLAVGTDRDERCLELARQAAARHNLRALFRVEAITELAEEAAYDLVYCRFLLTHLPDPGDALKRMLRALRPGGVLVAEDIEFAAHFCHPPCPAFARYVELYQRAVQKKGADPNIGPRLVGLFLDAGSVDVNVEVVQPTFRTGPGKRIAPVTMEHIGEAVVQEGLASAAEIQRTVAELEQFADDPRTIMSMPRIFQVWGRKG